MKLYAIAATIGLLTNVGATNVSPTDTNVEFQTLTVPNYSISFDRGSYKIVELKYDKDTILSDKEIINILELAGFRGNGLKMAWAVAVRESTLRPFALNKTSNCYGLFQINMSGTLGPDRRNKYGLDSNENLFDPLTNAKIAYQMSNGGKNWSAWSTETSAKRLSTQFPG
jgi:hypothetical protein